MGMRSRCAPFLWVKTFSRSSKISSTSVRHMSGHLQYDRGVLFQGLSCDSCLIQNSSKKNILRSILGNEDVFSFTRRMPYSIAQFTADLMFELPEGVNHFFSCIELPSLSTRV